MVDAGFGVRSGRAVYISAFVGGFGGRGGGRVEGA
jgi:hypothetical protein